MPAPDSQGDTKHRDFNSHQRVLDSNPAMNGTSSLSNGDHTKAEDTDQLLNCELQDSDMSMEPKPQDVDQLSVFKCQDTNQMLGSKLQDTDLLMEAKVCPQDADQPSKFQDTEQLLDSKLQDTEQLLGSKLTDTEQLLGSNIQDTEQLLGSNIQDTEQPPDEKDTLRNGTQKMEDLPAARLGKEPITEELDSSKQKSKDSSSQKPKTNGQHHQESGKLIGDTEKLTENSISDITENLETGKPVRDDSENAVRDDSKELTDATGKLEKNSSMPEKVETLQSSGNRGELDKETKFRDTEERTENKRDRPMEDEEKEKEEEKEEEEGGSEEEDPHNGVPVDRGWAWVIMMANFFITCLMVGYGRALSVFLLEFIDMFQVPVTTTTVAFGLMTVCFGFGNVLASHVLMPRLGTRKLVMMGAFVYSLFVALTALAPNMTFVTITHCFIGFSHALMYVPSVTLLGHYFDKRRSFAMAVANSGVSMSALVFPPLSQALITHFGPRGALLIIAGLAMQSLVAASLLRPVSYYTKQVQRSKAVAKVTVTKDTVAKDVTKVVTVKATATKSLAVNETTGEKSRAGVRSQTSAESDEVLKRLLDTDLDLDTVKGQGQKCETSAQKTGSDRRLADRDGTRIPASSRGNVKVETRRSDSEDGAHRNLEDNAFQNEETIPFFASSMPERSFLSSGNEDDYELRTLTSDHNKEADWRKTGNDASDWMKTTQRDASHDENSVEKGLSTRKNHPTAGLESDRHEARARHRRTRTYSCPAESGDHDVEGQGTHNPPHNIYGSTNLTTSMRILHNAFSSSIIDVGIGSVTTINKVTVEPLNSKENLAHDNDDDSSSSTSKVDGKGGSLCRRCASVFELSLFKNWLFRLILAYAPFGMSAGFIGFYFPSLGVTNGLSRPNAALLMTVVGGVDLCSRLAIGYIADLKVVRRTHLVAVCLTIIGLVSQFTRFYGDFGLLATYAVAYGLTGGVCQNLLAVVIIDLLGLSNLGKAMGLVLVINAANASITHVIIGALADASGSFAASYNYIGAGLLLAALIIMLEPLARKLEDKRLAKLQQAARDSPKV